LEFVQSNLQRIIKVYVYTYLHFTNLCGHTKVLLILIISSCEFHCDKYKFLFVEEDTILWEKWLTPSGKEWQQQSKQKWYCSYIRIRFRCISTIDLSYCIFLYILWYLQRIIFYVFLQNIVWQIQFYFQLALKVSINRRNLALIKQKNFHFVISFPINSRIISQ
jgi:hypothetical protein